MTTASAWAAYAADAPFAPFHCERRALAPDDIRIDILFCGVCHSDVHFVRGEWSPQRYPIVPGHEIVGRVSAVGSAVTGFAVGDLAGVGCLVDSCGHCASCGEGLEQYCETGATGTYGGIEASTGRPTYGGYSSFIVVREAFALHIRHDPAQLAAVAPLLCAGITVWSPLRHWQAGPGRKVGVVGIGGLGHMAVKYAHALGAQVVAFTTSPEKAAEARRLGADEVILSREPGSFAPHANSFDLIVNTVSARQDLEAQMGLLRRDGALVLVGAGPEQHAYPRTFSFIGRRRTLAGSLIGGIAETQEMLDFSAAHGIVADVELIGVDGVDRAYDRVAAGDVKYRFVIDLATLPAA